MLLILKWNFKLTYVPIKKLDLWYLTRNTCYNIASRARARWFASLTRERSEPRARERLCCSNVERNTITLHSHMVLSKLKCLILCINIIWLLFMLLYLIFSSPYNVQVGWLRARVTRGPLALVTNLSDITNNNINNNCIILIQRIGHYNIWPTQ